jgi:curved DNA binding protein
MVEPANADQEQMDAEASFIETPAVLDKHKAAGEVTDAALKKAIELAKAGADIHQICMAIDKMMEEELKKVFSNKKSKKLERGIAFPCSISVNQICGHFSPLPEEPIALQEGDVAKIDLGCHIDGYACMAAHTIVVGDAKTSGRKADVILAAYHAQQAALRTIKEMATNTQVTEAIAGVSEEFKCSPLEGVLSHKLKKHLIDGNDTIINKATPEQQVEEFEFAPGDVIGLDILISTGEGKTKESEFRTTVFKRELDMQYQLKSNRARQFFNEVNTRYPTLPFSISGFADQVGSKLGVKECVSHDLLIPYSVLTEKTGEYVAHFKCTIAVLPKSLSVIAGNIDFDTAKFESEHSVKDEELKALLASSMWKKEEKGKKPKKA